MYRTYRYRYCLYFATILSRSQRPLHNQRIRQAVSVPISTAVLDRHTYTLYTITTVKVSIYFDCACKVFKYNSIIIIITCPVRSLCKLTAGRNRSGNHNNAFKIIVISSFQLFRITMFQVHNIKSIGVVFECRKHA